MRKLLNTLYIMQEKSYVSLDGENIVILADNKEKFRIPFCNIESIVCFNYTGVSPAFMGKCVEENVALSFIKPSGKFLARVSGKTRGSIHLRRKQFALFEDESFCLSLIKTEIAAKLHNQRMILARALRDHKEKLDADAVNAAIGILSNGIESILQIENEDTARGIEGEGAKAYYRVFNNLILVNKESFHFTERSKRPPLDNVNAMLSFLYVMLANDVQSALETVGLDPYLGFFHSDRAGRPSLALDIMEEMRPTLVDRLVLNMINLNMITDKDFIRKEGGGVLFTDDGIKTVLRAWQDRKNEEIYHPVIKEKIKVGLLPYVQAQLLAKFIRNEISEYQPYIYDN